MNKQELISLIKKRIEAEHKKHPTLSWQRFAASKIATTLFELNLLHGVDGMEPTKEEKISRITFKSKEEQENYLKNI